MLENMSAPASPPRLGTWASLKAMTRSWRLASVVLLSFSSGLPLGLVWIAIPDWMRSAGVDLRVVGLFSLTQAPWTFKFLWSPLMDRYAPPRWGRRRGWAALAQVALAAFTFALAGVGTNPEAAWVVAALAPAIAFPSATPGLATALIRPFLHDMGYDSFHRGFAMGTIGVVATLFGTFLGGALTTALGLGHCLWIFGVLQALASLGYVLLAGQGVNLPLMYSATAFESLVIGMGTGAFSVLLVRLTQKRFSATQYALFSSLFGLPRILSGPIAGFAAQAFGWKTFFWGTIAAGIPGLLILARLVPLGVRDPVFEVAPPRLGPRLTRAQI